MFKKSPKSSYAIVNFSGIRSFFGKQQYKAGSDGLFFSTAETDLVHYRVEVEPGSPASKGVNCGYVFRIWLKMTFCLNLVERIS